jgi:hypothetical protein
LRTKSSTKLSRLTNRRRSTIAKGSLRTPLQTSKSKLEIGELTWIMKISIKSSANRTEKRPLKAKTIRKRRL